MSQKILDVDTLLHVKNTVQPQTTALHWPLIITATLGTLMTVLILYLLMKKILERSTLRSSQKQPEQHVSIPLQEVAVNSTNAEPQCDSTVYTYAIPVPR
jgi:hypothetical protein